MTTNVQVFSHPLFGDIRVAGTYMEPLFCLVDVCNALDIKNPSRAKTALKSGGVHLMKVTTTQKNQHGESDKKHEVYFTFISELNFYKLIMRSDKPQAEPFQDWVCGDVLPAIRKDGGYQLNVKIGQLEARIASQKLLLNETCAVVAKQEQDIDHLFDDASYAIDVLRSISCYTTTQVAKEMGLTAQELTDGSARSMCSITRAANTCSMPSMPIADMPRPAPIMARFLRESLLRTRIWCGRRRAASSSISITRRIPVKTMIR